MQQPWTNFSCRIIAAEEAASVGERQALLVFAQTFDQPGVTLLCQPSVVGARTGPPDIAIVDPGSGVHTVEVKGVGIESVRSVQAGGAIEIEYSSGRKRIDPCKQAQKAMFDIKDAATRYFGGDLNIAFESWVAFPMIWRTDWEAKFGSAVTERADVLFADDLESSRLGDRMRQNGRRRLGMFQLRECPLKQLESVMAAFGDSAVLAPPPRPSNKPPEGSKGERLNEALAEYRVLTEHQQRLVSSEWKDGPRLVRGVAGSGKTVVLATQVARTVKRLQDEAGGLFADGAQPPPVLVACFNRALAPFIQERIERSYQQRTGGELPKGSVMVRNFNRVLWALHKRGYCGYRSVKTIPDSGQRSQLCLNELDALQGDLRQRMDAGLFHAVFVDEGQDFHENDYRVLLRLVKRNTSGDPRIFIFYDDAQNLYGMARPTWSNLGLKIVGRSEVMDESFRNTRQILEPAFNMLLGSHADDPMQVRTRGFADTNTLKEKGLIEWRSRHIHVKFTQREGDPVEVEQHADAKAEAAAIAERCGRWIEREGMLPQDIMVLTKSTGRARLLAKAIRERVGEEVVRLVIEDSHKDELAVREGAIAVSTTASAKGYDAPAIIVAGAEEFEDDTGGRASLYVGCTRAREWLVFSSAGESSLVTEMGRAIEASTR